MVLFSSFSLKCLLDVVMMSIKKWRFKNFRHAVTVAPTSGHPYNQLALLEAGRGNRLAAVALYVRAMCVPCPFPGAPANLTQTLTKVLASW